jgi:hypothetical protein
MDGEPSEGKVESPHRCCDNWLRWTNGRRTRQAHRNRFHRCQHPDRNLR